MENDQIEKLKELLSIHFKNELKHKKTFYLEKFNDNIEAKQYILEMFRNIEQEVIDNYKISYEEDEEKISEIVGRYYVNIIVDNSDNENPNVIFEDDPSLENLIGTIEYENRNGNYYTDTNLIKAGALIKANEGCLVLKMNSLLMHPNSYYYLKKALLNDKVSFNYNKGYLELISLNGINPEPIDIKEKVIIIGDILTYDYLYNFDEDFRKIFKIRIQFDEEQNVNEETINSISDFLDNYSKINDINKIENCCKKEVIKYLSRKIENRNKVLFDLETIKTIVTLSNNVAKEKNKENIDGEDVRDVVYKKDSLQLDIEKMYSDKKILFNISDRKIGQLTA
jgi:predicted ATP-dependent protease